MTAEIKALFDYQRQTLKRVGQSGKQKITSEYNFYNYCKRIYDGCYSPLEQKRITIELEDSSLCSTLYEYACRIIWYGRNQAAALYTSDCYKPVLKYN